MRGCRAIALGAALFWRVVGLAGFAPPVLADHTVFSYGVDRIEVDGQGYGPFDGHADLIDEEFQPISPLNWGRPRGTARWRDGITYLTNPGVHLPGPEGQPLDLSLIASHRYFADGHGDFAVTTYWEPHTPEPGHHFHFSIYTSGNDSPLHETFGLGFQNLPGGHGIEQHLTNLDLAAGTYENFMSHFVPVSVAEVTGEIAFRLLFHDASNLMTSSFSLDGGATWRSPFPPGEIFRGPIRAIFVVSADPTADSTTTTTTTTTSTTLPRDRCLVPCQPMRDTHGVLRLADYRNDHRDSLTWRGRSVEPTQVADFGDPETSAYDLCLIDATGDIILQSSVGEGERCFGNPCWRPLGSRGYQFTDTNGSRGGIRRIVFRKRRASDLSIVITAGGLGLRMPDLPLALPVLVRLRASNGACWAGVVDRSRVRVSTPATFIGATARAK